jgi:hypothetical protein
VFAQGRYASREERARTIVHYCFRYVFFCQDIQVHWSHPKNRPVRLILPRFVGFGSLRDHCFVFFQKKDQNSAAVSDTLLFSCSIFGFQSNIVVEAIQCILLVRRSEQCIELLHYHLILSLPCWCLLSGLASSSVEIVAPCPSLNIWSNDMTKQVKKLHVIRFKYTTKGSSSLRLRLLRDVALVRGDILVKPDQLLPR